jgi:acylphosphatase
MVNVKVHAFVSGKVQGVFFRQSTQFQAQRLGVKGWIRNLSDGRVEAIFEGEEKAVNALVNFFGKGPRGASVTNITVNKEKIFEEDFQSFEIIY